MRAPAGVKRRRDHRPEMNLRADVQVECKTRPKPPGSDALRSQNITPSGVFRGFRAFIHAYTQTGNLLLGGDPPVKIDLADIFSRGMIIWGNPFNPL
mgnify:CR=1 FL=1